MRVAGPFIVLSARNRLKASRSYITLALALARDTNPRYV
jgi:hypothetical protein